MSCFASQIARKKSRRRRTSRHCVNANVEGDEEEAKMTRTYSAPSTFLRNTSSASPLFVHGRAVALQRLTSFSSQQQNDSLITHSGNVSGYNSLSGLKCDLLTSSSPLVFHSQPLPLPTPESCGVSTPPESPAPRFSYPSPMRMRRSPMASPAINGTRRPMILLPLPPLPIECISASSSPPWSFTIDKLAAACNEFAPEYCLGQTSIGTAYRCRIVMDNTENTEATIIRLADNRMQESDEEWIKEVKFTASLWEEGSKVSRILGFCWNTTERLVIYQCNSNSSLDKLLYGRRSRERPPLDWETRVKIVVDVAHSLAHLFQKSPNKLMCKEIRTLDIYVDKNFNAVLSGYGFVDNGSTSLGEVMWSYGVVVLEILSGRANGDEMFCEEERDLVKWANGMQQQEPLDLNKLILIVDPELKGRYCLEEVIKLAEIAFKCLHKQHPSIQQLIHLLDLNNLNKNNSNKPLIRALKEGRNSSLSSSAMMVGRHQNCSSSMAYRFAKTLRS